MLIRDERAADASRITQIQYAAFTNHPHHPPGAEPVEQRIVVDLRASGALTLSLLAEVDRQTMGQAVGHVALSPAIVGREPTGWFLLGPIGVLPRFQGKGTGSALVHEALRRMRALGAKGVVLVGDPGFYARFGFEAVQGLIYPGVPDQFVLAVRLGDTAPQGEIIAHRAFAQSA
jgi:putative acetyltransferase